MLHQTLSKGWCRHGSGLLLGLIVRAVRRLVEARPLLEAAEDRSACPAQRLGGLDPAHPCPVASLPQRAGLLAFRLFSAALLLPYPLLTESVRPAGRSPGARAARSAARIRPGTRRAFGDLLRPGHDSRPNDGANEGFSQGALLRASDVRQERLQDRLGLRVQGGSGGRPRGRGKCFRAGTCGLEASAGAMTSRTYVGVASYKSVLGNNVSWDISFNTAMSTTYRGIPVYHSGNTSTNGRADYNDGS
jgi:hypothetical protein